MKIINLGRFAAAALLAVLVMPAPSAHAQERTPDRMAPLPPADGPVDKWGLTDRDWLTKMGPQLRAKAGFPHAFDRVLAAAKEGDVKAAALISGAYAAGSGTLTNSREALRWAMVASDGGLPFGHFILGLWYKDPEGLMARDVGKAAALFRQAVDSGHRIALVDLLLLFPTSEVTRHQQFAWAAYLDQAANEGLESENIDKLNQATNYNFRLSEILESAAYNNFGNSLLGSNVGPVIPATPCVTYFYNGPFTVFWNTITEVTAGGESGLWLHGPIAQFNIQVNSYRDVLLRRISYPARNELGFRLQRRAGATAEEQQSRDERVAFTAIDLKSVCRSLYKS